MKTLNVYKEFTKIGHTLRLTAGHTSAYNTSMIQILNTILLLLALVAQNPQYEVYHPAVSDITEQVQTIVEQEQEEEVTPPPSLPDEPPEEPFNRNNPGNCIVAESQCNTCRRMAGGTFACTLAYCDNEEFICTQYGAEQKKKTGAVRGVRETDMAPETVKEHAKTFLAQHLGVRVEDLVYMRSEKVVWSDTSLGCPEVGYMYATVETPGYTLDFLEHNPWGHAPKGPYTVHTNNTGSMTAICNT